MKKKNNKIDVFVDVIRILNKRDNILAMSDVLKMINKYSKKIIAFNACYSTRGVSDWTLYELLAKADFKLAICDPHKYLMNWDVASVDFDNYNYYVVINPDPDENINYVLAGFKTVDKSIEFCKKIKCKYKDLTAP